MQAGDLPDDIEALKALVLESRATIAAIKAAHNNAEALLVNLRIELLRLQRAQFGQSSERRAHLIDQLQLSLEDIEGDIVQDSVAAETQAAAAQGAPIQPAGSRRQPKRGPLPAHLPRERVVLASPSSCPCCGSEKLSILGEDVTETLEIVPRKFFVRQTVRERWSCRACEKITQPPAPFHVIARGRAGPSLLAMILAGKYDLHLPLNRQSESFAHEGVAIEVSTMADWVGACAAALEPLTQLIREHVFAAERIHADDTPVPVLAKGKTRTGRLWTYVRDDKPFGGPEAPATGPPAAIYYYSPDRGGAHPRKHLQSWSGLMQADAYAGFAALYAKERKPGAIIEAACWAHGRRKFFELADVARQKRSLARAARLTLSPIAVEAVKRIDAIFDIEREINGLSAQQRLAVRQERIKPLVDALLAWMKAQRARVSAKSAIAKAMDYMLKRWPAFTRFLDDGRACLSNNAAERMIRPLAVGRRNWTFAGSDRGGERAAAIYTLLQTAKLNDVDPQAWLADVLARIAALPAARLAELLPWNWKPQPAPA
jgi:transposase